MSDLEQRIAALRQEIDHLKAALQTTTDELERSALHIRLNDCIRASVQMIDERIEMYNTYLALGHRAASELPAAAEALRERSVGE
jgi:predicted RNase H-like nuclease (RuvC/YqgF family)